MRALRLLITKLAAAAITASKITSQNHLRSSATYCLNSMPAPIVEKRINQKGRRGTTSFVHSGTPILTQSTRSSFPSRP
jgi:hypothetical protein